MKILFLLLLLASVNTEYDKSLNDAVKDVNLMEVPNEDYVCSNAIASYVFGGLGGEYNGNGG